MGGAAEVPDEGGAFDAPVVPDAVVAEVVVLVVGEAEGVDAAVLFEALHDFFDVGGAEHVEEGLEGCFEVFFLVGAEFGDEESGDVGLLPFEDDGFWIVGGFFAEEGFFALFAVEGFVDFVCEAGLVPPYVAGVVGAFVEFDGVSVEDGAAEGGVLDGIAVGAEGGMAAGEDPFEVVFAGVAEECAGVFFKSSGVVFHLALEALVAVFGEEALEDVAQDFLLVGGVEFSDGAFALVDDVPVVGDLFAEGVVEGEVHELALGFGEAFIEKFDVVLRGFFERCAAFWGRAGGKGLCRGGGGEGGSGGLEETASAEAGGGCHGGLLSCALWRWVYYTSSGC